MVERAARRSSDAPITAEREERKYLLAPDRARPFLEQVAAHLAPHHHEQEGDGRLPYARHHATTIYFDTPDGALYRAAVASERHAKLRAREYYDLHPELTELATDPSQLVRYDSTLWLELKLRDGPHTEKRRIGIPKTGVARYFETGQVSARMLEIQRQAHREEAEAVLEELSAFRARFAQPLSAVALVNYRREAWQAKDGGLRLTLDRGLAVFPPPRDLWQRKQALVRESLGAALRHLPERVLEVKTLGPVPAWLQAALRQAGTRESDFSKFVYACEAVRDAG